MNPPPPCPGCGLVRPPAAGPTHATLHASPGCWALYTEVLGAEYSDPGRWAVHGLTVDAYAAQHPGGRSAAAVRSLGTHLLSLALVVERDLPVERAARLRKTIADRLAEGFTWLEPPELRGGITVSEVAGAPDAEEHRRRVRRWARAVWHAWRPRHDTVLRWLDWLVAASPPGLLPDTGPGRSSADG